MTPTAKALTLGCAALALASCGRITEVGRTPPLAPIAGSPEHFAMTAPTPAPVRATVTRAPTASLWNAGRGSLLGDRRASLRGDILTVLIAIDDRAEISNSTQRGRSNGANVGIDNLFGIEDMIPLPITDGVGLNASSETGGDGSIRRRERLTLQIAATVVEVLPNGALRIEGTQEVRINNEVRVLLVSGFVRPEDVTRQNQITYEKIASARISYGGRGHITDVQSPRIGSQIADIVLPF